MLTGPALSKNEGKPLVQMGASSDKGGRGGGGSRWQEYKDLGLMLVYLMFGSGGTIYFAIDQYNNSFRVKTLHSKKTIEQVTCGRPNWAFPYIRRTKLYREFEMRMKANDFITTIIVTGPRGCGKSTFVRECLEGKNAILINMKQGREILNMTLQTQLFLVCVFHVSRGSEGTDVVEGRWTGAQLLYIVEFGHRLHYS